MQTMTNYNPKNVQRANDLSRQEEQNREEMYQIGMNQASGTTLNSPPAHIQIEDMGGMVNMTQDYERKGLSGINSDSHSMMAGGVMTKGDPSRLGHATRTTDYTSNMGVHTTQGGHGVNRTTSAIGSAGVGHQSMGGMFAPGAATPTAGAESILNYPYSYDQDQKHEVDFAERLYRANHEV